MSQLDAHILDNELFTLLRDQLSESFKLLLNKRWSYELNPDLWSLILRLTIFGLTTWKTGSSYGYKLQNLKLSNASTGDVIGLGARYLLLASIIGDYLLSKILSRLYALEGDADYAESLWEKFKATLARHKDKLLKYSGNSLKVLESINFVLFLVQGKYSSIRHRILGISVTPVIADLLKFTGNNVNFEFQNRQLVWNVLTEFLVFILPLLQLQKLRRTLRNIIPRSSSYSKVFVSPQPIKTKHTNLASAQCAMCIDFVEANGILAVSTQITNACVTNCGHVFCYVCLAARFNAIKNGSEEAEGCPRCRVKLTLFRPLTQTSDNYETDAIMIKNDDLSELDHESDSEDNGITVEKRSGGSSAMSELDSNIEDSPGSLDTESQYNENEDLEEELDMESEGEIFEDNDGDDDDEEILEVEDDLEDIDDAIYD